jgi:hypothetical protein
MAPRGKRAADVALYPPALRAGISPTSKSSSIELANKGVKIAVFICYCSMRTFQIRQSGEMADEKPTTNVQQAERSANGDLANSTERDAADMRKLGVQQETKVRSRLGENW